MTRVCFRLRVRPEVITDYVRRHSPVPRAMLEEIAASGRRNYSLFIDDRGTLIGFYETDDDDAAQAYLAASTIAAAWEAEMAPYFDGLNGRPDQSPDRLTEIFHLKAQLTNATASAPPESLPS